MEFLSFDSKNKSLTLKKSDVPVPKPNEVLVKVSHAGICGTDLHIIEGAFPCKPDGPVTLGHEFSGVVQAIGSSVKTFAVGQNVVVDPNAGCNICDYCHSGDYHFCRHSDGINNTVGIHRDGGWSTHAVVPESQVHLVPDGVNLAQAALVEPLSCLAHGWDRLDPVHIGTRVLIIGAGIIGSLWSSLLHLRGQRKTVTISEPQPKRRELFQNLNLDYQAVSPADLKGREFDLVIDCSGSAPAIEASLPLLSKGGRLCIFGVANPQAEVKVKPFDIYMKELTILGVNINPFTFPKALAMTTAMGDTYLNYERLGIGVYKLSEYQTALTALKNDSGYEALSPAKLKGREYDLAIDCSGSLSAMEEAIPLLGRGGRFCVFGVTSPDAEIKVKPFDVYKKELTIIGVNVNPFSFPKALASVRAMSDEYLDFAKLGVGVYKLSQYQDALNALKNGEITKVVFEL